MIRKPHPTDQSYIAATWVNSLSLADRDVDRSELGLLVDKALDASETRILVYCDPDAPRMIAGWIAYSENPRVRTIFYLYVRDKLRRHGIGRALFEAAFRKSVAPIAYVFRGPSASMLLGLYPGAVHVPNYLER